MDETVAELVKGKNFAALTTIMKDGSPQTQVMWVDADDDFVLINTEVHRQKFKNVERDPRVTVMIWDAQNSYRYVEVRGIVEATQTGPVAREHIDTLSRRYAGRLYDDRNIRSERVLLKIRPRRFVHFN
jgi:PPOX class probable F420-dependent enzyme